MIRLVVATVPALTLISANAIADDAQPTDRPPTAEAASSELQKSQATNAHIGHRGQLVITSGTQLEMRRSVMMMGTGPLSTQTSVSLTPSLDYLLTDHLTIGGSIGFGLATGEDGFGRAMLFSVSPRVGYLIPLGAQASLWPQLNVAYARGFLDYSNYEATSAGVSVPLIVQLAPHFFVGAGPQFNMTRSSFYSASAYVASSGMTAMIGGFL